MADQDEPLTELERKYIEGYDEGFGNAKRLIQFGMEANKAKRPEPSSPSAGAQHGKLWYPFALRIVQQAYVNNGRPIIGNADELEAIGLANLIAEEAAALAPTQPQPSAALKLRIQELVGLPTHREIDDDLIVAAIRAQRHALNVYRDTTTINSLPSPPAEELARRIAEKCIQIIKDYRDDSGDIGLDEKDPFDRGWKRCAQRILAAIERETAFLSAADQKEKP